MAHIYAVCKFGNIVAEKTATTLYQPTFITDHLNKHTDLYAISKSVNNGTYLAFAYSSHKYEWVRVPMDTMPKLIQMKVLMGAL